MFALLLSMAWVFAVGSTIVRAHPLGNDSIAHFDVLDVRGDRFELDYLLDIAESPAQYFEDNEIDSNKDGQVTSKEQETWLATKAVEFAKVFEARVDDTALRLKLVPDEVDKRTGRIINTNKLIVPMLGPMGMTYRIVIRYVATYPKPLGIGEHSLFFEDKTLLSYQGLRLILLQFSDLLPYCEILKPHPPFISPDNTVFRYDQYDPLELPNVRQAVVRFKIFQAKSREALPINKTLSRTPRLAPTSTSAPAGLGPTTQAATAKAASRPAHAAAPKFQQYSSTFLDSSFNSLQPTAHKQQAEKMIKLLKGRWGFPLFLIVTMTAFVWGAAHAIMPGHAKTVVAAYLISQRGSYWHALVLAIIVTVTHTALVVALGVVVYAYQQSNPRLGPMLQLWLGLAAGVMVAGMGLLLVWRALTGRIAEHDHLEPGTDQQSWFRRLFTHSHPQVPAGLSCASDMVDHDYTHVHAHPHNHAHAHAHTHGHEHTHAADRECDDAFNHAAKEGDRRRSNDGRMTFRSLLALGIAGGIVPCPTATIILLLGIGADVVAGALYAIVVFSLGLALTLMLIGVAALTSRKYASRLMANSNREGELTTTGRQVLLQIVPALSGLAVILLGTAIAVHYACRINGMQSPPFAWVG